MQLIIDSGATKTEYLIASRGESRLRRSTAGLNINYAIREQIDGILCEIALDIKREFPHDPLLHLFYYGAGCGNPSNAGKISEMLGSHFPDVNIRVRSDLWGACHAMCGDQPGWVAILGTGSSSCFYDGKEIVHKAPSLGYFLGDEGSGTHLGKLFVTAYLSGDLPEEIKNRFDILYGLDESMIMDRLYRQPFPNRFLSSFAPFILENSQHPYIRKICRNSFRLFLENQIRFYGEQLLSYPLNLMGSVAFHFRDLIEEEATGNRVHLGKIIVSPLDYLSDYYRNI